LALEGGPAVIKAPAPMVLMAVDDHSAKLRARVRLRPPFLVAVAFWFAATLPLFVPEQRSIGHFASSALLAAIGIALAHPSFRQQRRTIVFADRTFQADDRLLPLAQAREIVLTGSDGEGLEPSYQAHLVFDGGQRELLLEHHEPARVLQDLTALYPLLRLPIRRGWGLPESAMPWESRDISMVLANNSNVKSEQIEVAAGGVRRPAAALIVGALVLGTVQAILVARTLERAPALSPFSVGLALASILTVLLLGFMVLTRRFVVTVGPRVAIERRLLGFGVRTLAAAPAPVRGAWAVSPEGRSPRHVLIATEGEPLSVACEGDAAASLAERLLAGPR
jgi:hypothetical protein